MRYLLTSLLCVFTLSLTAQEAGCTYSIANNYSSTATVDDGSCCYGSSFTLWNQLGQDIDGEYANDKSGQSVSSSTDGNIVAIGAWGNDVNGMESGHVRVYENISGTWDQIGQDIDGNAGERFGQSFSMSNDGNKLAIGGYGPNGWSGVVRVFENISNNWVLQFITNGPSGSFFWTIRFLKWRWNNISRRSWK